MERLALVLHTRGEREEAVELLTAALDIRQTVQGEAHTATRRTADALRRVEE